MKKPLKNTNTDTLWVTVELSPVSNGKICTIGSSSFKTLTHPLFLALLLTIVSLLVAVLFSGLIVWKLNQLFALGISGMGVSLFRFPSFWFKRTSKTETVFNDYLPSALCSNKNGSAFTWKRQFHSPVRFLPNELECFVVEHKKEDLALIHLVVRQEKELEFLYIASFQGELCFPTSDRCIKEIDKFFEETVDGWKPLETIHQSTHMTKQKKLVAQQ